ncbi:MAG: GHKL domain-containing protein [Christensenella sp.]|nr:GHKL domain-containing protein [Christensenella sp.]
MSIPLSVSTLILYAVTIIPYAIGCYIPYWNQLKINRRTLLVLLALAFAAETLILGWIPDSDLSNLVFFVICIFNFVLFIKTVAADAMQLLFIFLLFMQFAALLRGISFFIEAHYFPEEQLFSMTVPANYIFAYLLELGLSMLIIIPISILLKKHLVPLISAINMRQWRLLFVIPLMFLAVILIITLFMTNQVANFLYLFLLISLAAGSVAIYYIIFLMLRGVADTASLREENLTLGFREQYYNMISERIDESRKVRHDMRHHIRLLATFLENQEYDNALEYLEEYSEIISASDSLAYCKNYAINAILNYYIQRAHADEIKTVVSASIPEECFVKATDLCGLLGNCLENAIEGCKRQTSGKKWIHIHLNADENKMAIAIDNSCGNVQYTKKGDFLSTKTERMGIGLSSIHSVAQKYDGSAWFESDGSIFQTSIVLHKGT